MDNFKEYSWNWNDSTTGNATEKGYWANYTHTYIENCWVLNPLTPAYYAFTGGWLLIAMVYIGFLYVKVPVDNRHPMQKLCMILPVIKALEVGLEGGYLSMCPWYSVGSSGIQYVQMARISVVTIAYTIFLSFFYLLCKGWQTTCVQLNRQQATNLTMIMGGVYLTYSAFFLSVDFDTIYTVMNIILLLLYLALGFTYGRNCKINMGSI